MQFDRFRDKDELRELVFNIAEYGHASDGVKIIDIGSDHFVNFFAGELLAGLVSSGGSTCRFVEGTAGSGKTHTLRLIADEALDRGFVVCWINLNVVTRLFDWDKIVKEILKNLIVRTEDGVMEKGLWNVLNYYSEEISSFEHLKILSMDHPGFQNAVIRALNPSKLDDRAALLLQQYLHGEEVKVSDLRSCGINDVKNHLSAKNAEKVLTTVLNCLAHLDPANEAPKGTALFFDETDDSFDGRNRSKVEASANVFRRLVDSFKVGSVCRSIAVFGVLPNFMDDCMHNYAALGQRLWTFDLRDDIVPWRYTKVPVSSINPMSKQEFLKEAVEKALTIIEYLDGDLNGAQSEMHRLGSDAIERVGGKIINEK